MTEIKLPFRISKIREVPESAQSFYRRAEDGSLELQLDGEHPDTVKLKAVEQKLNEFRDNNRSLNAKAAELETQLAAFTGVDVAGLQAQVAALSEEKAALAERMQAVEGIDDIEGLKAAAQKLPETETRLREVEAALGRTRLNHEVTTAFLSAGGRRDAAEFIAAKAAEAFSVRPDGTVTSTMESSTRPGQPLSISEFVETQLVATPFAFQPSRGSGATPNSGAPPSKLTISKYDAEAFGKHAEQIAAGNVRVE